MQKLQSCFPMILDSYKSLKSSANNYTKIWKGDCYETSDCWYNLIKVLDDEYALVIGLSNFTTFFDKKNIGNSDPDFNPNSLQNFFNVSDCDILSVVNKLSSYDWDVLPLEYTSVEPYLCEIHEVNNSSTETNNIYVQRFNYVEVNDSFNVFTTVDKTKFYAWHSPTLEELIDGDYTQENSFPYVFIPFDLSMENVWREDYNKWKELYDS